MPNLDWTPALSTGVSRIDADHHEIFELTRSLVSHPGGHETLGGGLALLKHLHVHVVRHFSEEEEQMQRSGYLHVLAHEAEHRRLFEYVTSLCKEVHDDRADPDLLSVSNRLLCNWLVRHIMTFDQDLASCLRKQGHGTQRPQRIRR
jgi:hemerythrin